jgi:hypothetical protein
MISRGGSVMSRRDGVLVRDAGREFVRPAGFWLRFVRFTGPEFVQGPPLPISVPEPNSLQNPTLARAIRPGDPGEIPKMAHFLAAIDTDIPGRESASRLR